MTPRARLTALVEGSLAANIFDWGAAACVELYHNGAAIANTLPSTYIHLHMPAVIHHSWIIVPGIHGQASDAHIFLHGLSRIPLQAPSLRSTATRERS